MPETGSADAAAVVAWLKQPGRRVEAGEPICLVAWDDVTAEVTSPATGVLRMLALAAGHRAATGTSLAVIDVGVRSTSALASPSSEPDAVPDGGPNAAPVAQPGPFDLGGFLSPAVRRFSQEHGVDPGPVEGTGRDGRVTLRDLTGDG